MLANNVPATPAIYHLGIDDQSVETVPREPVARPQHCPKFFVFAQRGRGTPTLVSSAEATVLYGERSFQTVSPYFNHSSFYAKRILGKGNACVVQRLIPDDAPPPASLRLSLDVLPTMVDTYDRNDDGSFATNALGAKVATGTAAGYKVKWVLEAANPEDDDGFASGSIRAGTQTAGSVTSLLYPIADLLVSFQGLAGNDIGVRLWAPPARKNPRVALMESQRVYPYNIAVVERKKPTDSPTVEKTVFQQRSVSFTFKPDVIDPDTNRKVDIDTLFLDSYRNTTDTRFPYRDGQFADLYVYRDNLETLLKQFHQAEIPFITEGYDFTASAGDIDLFNIVSGQSSEEVPYQTFQLVSGTGAVRLTEYTNLMCRGGDDGTMTNAVYETLVQRELDRYLDEDDSIQDMVMNPESHFYDTGFGFATKMALFKAIAIRKDTHVVVGTHIAGAKALPPDDQLAIAMALRTAADLSPESTFFGTGCTRATCCGNSGVPSNTDYTKRLPATYHLAMKSADLMGASSGYWKKGLRFSYAPNSVVNDMHDLDITWLGVPSRTKMWDVGLNWLQNIDRETVGYPGVKTVCSTTTSTLNNYFLTCVLGECVKVVEEVGRGLAGVDDMSDEQLVRLANKRFSARIDGRFDGSFIITPKATVDFIDSLRGDSWSLPITVYSDTTKRVMESHLVVRRKSQLVTTP